jgi:Abi-like protein.
MTLWRPALRGAFPHAVTLNRNGAHRPLDFLRTLRNRIAHHEPIFDRHLQQDYQSVLDLTGWISPHKRAWIEAHSRVPDLLTTATDDPRVRF